MVNPRLQRFAIKAAILDRDGTIQEGDACNS